MRFKNTMKDRRARALPLTMARHPFSRTARAVRSRFKYTMKDRRARALPLTMARHPFSGTARAVRLRFKNTMKDRRARALPLTMARHPFSGTTRAVRLRFKNTMKDRRARALPLTTSVSGDTTLPWNRTGPCRANSHSCWKGPLHVPHAARRDSAPVVAAGLLCRLFWTSEPLHGPVATTMRLDTPPLSRL
ncbi:hypothetical protein Enr13x_36010 [Stieleria neptunia]|uniref:Uncharacterized protein n=1 Tax=Stieleria neptunia TaxID=2527979 RepID=A0A518HSB4_9BACT|nr:hypothetical protein Enr13x_36010 [Stieleria neptunia]